MSDEQPQGHFTAIDLFWQLVHVGIISNGCYLGWIVGNTYLSLLLGGLIGYVVAIVFVLGLRRLAGVRS